MTRQLSRLGFALALIAALAFPPAARASILDNPFFQVLGLVIVWSGNGAAAPEASDFVLMVGAAATPGLDLIAADGRAVVTGDLVQAVDPTATESSIIDVTNEVAGGVYTDTDSNGYMNTGDTLTAFTMDATTDVALTTASHSFYVASNAPFAVYADTSAGVGPFVTTGAFAALTRASVGWGIGVTVTGTDGGFTFGANAQDPDSGPGGPSAATTLNDFFAAPALAYTADQRTASAVGTIIEQSVRFDLDYTMPTYDLSQGTGTLEASVLYTIYNP